MQSFKFGKRQARTDPARAIPFDSGVEKPGHAHTRQVAFVKGVETAKDQITAQLSGHIAGLSGLRVCKYPVIGRWCRIDVQRAPRAGQNRKADLVEPVHEIPYRLRMGDVALIVKTQEFAPANTQITIRGGIAEHAALCATQAVSGARDPPDTITLPILVCRGLPYIRMCVSRRRSGMAARKGANMASTNPTPVACMPIGSGPCHCVTWSSSGKADSGSRSSAAHSVSAAALFL